MWCSCRCNGIILREIHSHGAKRQVKVLLRYAANQKESNGVRVVFMHVMHLSNFNLYTFCYVAYYMYTYMYVCNARF